MLTNGQIFVIENDFLSVRVSSVGAALLSGKHKKYGDFLLNVNDDEFCEGYVGKTIAPWVNRVKKGEYTAHGKKYFLPVNDFENNAALHGFVAWNEFDLVELNESSIVLKTLIYPSPAYPFKVEVKVEYKLENESLSSKISITNLSDVSCPVGLCSHPYIVHPNAASIDECYFIVEGEYIDKDSYGANRRIVILKDTTIDACSKMVGDWKVILGHNANLKFPVRIVLSSDSEFLQLYTGESVDRKGFAVEPCTSNIDMFGDSKGGEFITSGETKVLEYKLKVEYGSREEEYNFNL